MKKNSNIGKIKIINKKQTNFFFSARFVNENKRVNATEEKKIQNEYMLYEKSLQENKTTAKQRETQKICIQTIGRKLSLDFFLTITIYNVYTIK